MARQTDRENCKVRVIAIYRILISGKKVNSAQIIEKLKAHYGITADRKTIYSDIAAIDRFVPIKSCAGRAGGFCLWDVTGDMEKTEQED